MRDVSQTESEGKKKNNDSVRCSFAGEVLDVARRVEPNRRGFFFFRSRFVFVGWLGVFFLFHKGIREERRAVGIGKKRMFGFTGSPPAPFAEGIICCRLYFDCSCCTGVAANVIRIRHITTYTYALHGS